MSETDKPLVVVMGVSGSGKSTVGAAAAALLGIGFVDGDDLHPLTNVDKMTAGIPLTDDDRWPWLATVGDTLAASDGLVVACSALKRSYRDAIRERAPRAFFVLLTGSPETIGARLSKREDHFMPASLLQSQFDTLEPLGADERGVALDIGSTPHQLAARLVEALGSPSHS